MGKISSYGTASTPSLGDKLIGTSVGGSPVNGTYNFTIQQLSNLISGQINLQTVLNTGNTATQSINLTGVITATSLSVGNITSTGTIYSKGISLDGNLSVGGISTFDNIVAYGSLKDSNGVTGVSGQVLSSTNTGVLWKSLTLQNVLDAGNTATQDMSLNGAIGVGINAMPYNSALSVMPNTYTPIGIKLYEMVNLYSWGITASLDDAFFQITDTEASNAVIFQIEKNTSVVSIGNPYALTSKLQVNGDGYFIKQGGANVSIVAGTYGSPKLTLLASSSGTGKSYVNASLSTGSLVLQTSTVDRVIIGNTGNVWIGATSSYTSNVAKLEVDGNGYFTTAGNSNVTISARYAGSASLTLSSQSTGGGKSIINAPLAGGTLAFQTQSIDRMYIDSNGSLIINNTYSDDPAAKLQVTGDSVFNGYSRFNGPIATTNGLYESVDNLPIAAFETSTGVFTYADGNLKVYSYGGINMQSLPELPSSTYGDLYVDVNGFVKIVR